MDRSVEVPFWQPRAWLLGALAAAGVGLALVAGWTISAGQWSIAAVALLAVPVGVLILRKPFVAVLLWLLVRPFIDSLPEPAGTQLHWLVHRFLLPAALGALLLGQWLGIRRRTRVRLGAPELAMGALLLLTLANILVSSWDTQDAVRLAFDRLVVPFCAYLLVRLLVPDQRQLTSLVLVGLAVMVMQVTVGLVSWYSPEMLPEALLPRAVRVGRTVGTLHQPAAYATTLVFTAVLLYHYALRCAAGGIRELLLLAVGVAAFGVFLSFSRDSWLGGLLVLGGLILVYPRQTLGLILVGGLILGVAVLGFGLLRDELAWAQERLTGEQGERSATGRMVLDRGMLEMTGEKPLFGWGYENHADYNARFMLPLEERAIPRRDRLTSHNAFLTLSTELGVPALLLYLFPVAWWLAQSFRAWPWLPHAGLRSRRLVAVLWLAVLFVVVCSNFVDTIRWGVYGMTQFWLALGIIASLVAPTAAEEIPDRGE